MSPRPVVRRAAALAVASLMIAVAASAQTRSDTSTTAPSPDPPVGLHAGWLDAAEALWNMKLVSFTQRPQGFVDDTNPGDFGYINSDLAFDGHYVIQGNFHGVEIWDISRPAHPTLAAGLVCPASQNDVSVYRNLLFVSVESVGSSLDCATLPGADSVDANRERGVRVALRVLRQQLVGRERSVGPARDHVGERAAAVDPELPAAHALVLSH